MGQKSRWDNAHIALRRLYEARAPKDMSQKEFGQKYGIGTQGMVNQYLSGYRPLNYDAAAKFARALGCTIYDISPEMAESLQLEILPFLGKALRRAASLAAFAVLPALLPSPADAAAPACSTPWATVYYVKRRILKAAHELVRFLTHLGQIARNTHLSCS